MEMLLEGTQRKIDRNRPQAYSVRSAFGCPAEQAVLLRMQGGCEDCEEVEEG